MKTSILKKIVAIILSLCLLTGITAVAANAETQAETSVIVIQEYETIRINQSGYSYGSGSSTHPFTGKYVLAGNSDGGIHFDEAGTYDVTIHNLDATSRLWCSSLTLSNGVILNLTVVGINKFYGDNHPGIQFEGESGTATVNLTVTEKSSVEFGSQYNETNVSVATNVTLTMSDNTAVPGTEIEGWRDSTLTVSNGTPAEHTLSYVQTADTHKAECAQCNTAFGAAEPHNISYNEEIDGETCAPYCEVCGLVEALAESHSMTGYYEYDSENCIKYCEDCYYEEESTGLVPHSMTKYEPYDDENCIIVCENCGDYDTATGLVPHPYDEGVLVPATEKESAYTKHTCESCRYFYKEYNAENSIIFKLYSEYESQWETSAILAYVNGKPVNLIRNMSATEWDTFALDYDENSSYVFKWINAGYNEEFGVEIYLPGSEEAAYSKIDMSEYEMLQTFYTVNVADYTAVDAALTEIPDYLEYYTADSVAALVTAVKGVERMLPAGKQAEVDAMAAAIEAAVDGLVSVDVPVAHGVINMSAGNYIYINDDYYSDKPGYTYYNADTYDETTYEYEGKYVILETEPKDRGSEDYVHYGIYTYTEEIEIDLVNTYITGYEGNLGIYNDASVILNLFGANALASYEDYDGYAGIDMDTDAKLHIKDSSGSLIAIGEDDCAGIGSYYDYYDDEGVDSGEIIIDGSTIFALSTGDGAGIGGGLEGGAGKITINGGTIYAECMSDDGSGIGTGDDGTGGEIIINGGDITALSIDDDGAGIGGADHGCVDSITINGGNIVAGSADGAAIGGGDDKDSLGRKIIINGGNISASEWHNADENLIGNGNSSSAGESEQNFVQINGGNIDDTNSKGISPAPKNADGKVLVKMQMTVHEYYADKEITLELSDGSTVTVTADGTTVTAYIPEGTTVTNADELGSDPTIIPDDPEDPNEGDDGEEEMFWLWKLILDIINWIVKTFTGIWNWIVGLFA